MSNCAVNEILRFEFEFYPQITNLGTIRNQKHLTHVIEIHRLLKGFHICITSVFDYSITKDPF